MSEQRRKNQSRINRFAAARSEYYDENSCLDEDATDMLADMMHWCQRMEIDFNDALDIATEHYEAER